MSGPFPPALYSFEIRAHVDYFSLVYSDLLSFCNAASETVRALTDQRDELLRATYGDAEAHEKASWLDDQIRWQSNWLGRLSEYTTQTGTLRQRGQEYAEYVRKLERSLDEAQSKQAVARQTFQAAQNDLVWDWLEEQFSPTTRAAKNALDEAEKAVEDLMEKISNATTQWYGEVNFRLTFDLALDPMQERGARKDREKDVSLRNGKHVPPWRTDSNGFPIVRITDINQGSNGNCYFVATFAAIASASWGSRFLKNLITDNGDGTFTVRFPGEPPITVDGGVYIDDVLGAPLYGTTNDPDSYWFQIIEKAYARLRGGWDVTDLGGDAGDIMKKVGFQVQQWVPGGDAIGLTKLLRSAQDGSAAVTASVLMEKLYSGQSGGHAMTVVGFSEGPPPTVLLRNPWGHHGGSLVGALKGRAELLDGGYVRIDLDAFEKTFRSVSAGRQA